MHAAASLFIACAWLGVACIAWFGYTGIAVYVLVAICIACTIVFIATPPAPPAPGNRLR